MAVKLLLGGFFLGGGSVPISVSWILAFFSSKSGVYEAERKPVSSPLCCSSGPKVPNLSAFVTFLSLPIF